jgi:iron complex transport system substrate-binding protein
MSREDAKPAKNDVAKLEEMAAAAVDGALKIHKALGPGLLESVYEVLLARQLARRGYRVERQRAVSFEFDGMTFRDALRLDLLVEDALVIEIKSAEQHHPVFFKQTLTYLRLMNLRLGLLINFGMPTLKQGVTRVANRMPSLPSSRLCANQSLPPPAAKGGDFPDRLDR